MGRHSKTPTVNAGSMADIAFLLLLFFLVTTSIETVGGLDRRLPRKVSEPITMPYQKRNICNVIIDEGGKLLVDEEMVTTHELRELVVDFVDNGGAPKDDVGYCSYCQGKADPLSSDSPEKALVTVTAHRQSAYGVYITVQNEIVAAYHQLRDREGYRLFQRSYKDMEAEFHLPTTSAKVKAKLKEQLKKLQEMYPLHILEPQPL